MNKIPGELPCVYMMYREKDKDLQSLPIKIGMTTNIRERASKLSCGSDCNMRVLALFPCKTRDGARFLENKIHKLLDEFKLRGEWYNLEKEKAKCLFMNLSEEMGSSAAVIVKYQTIMANYTEIVDHIFKEEKQ